MTGSARIPLILRTLFACLGGSLRDPNEIKLMPTPDLNPKHKISVPVGPEDSFRELKKRRPADLIKDIKEGSEDDMSPVSHRLRNVAA